MDIPGFDFAGRLSYSLFQDIFRHELHRCGVYTYSDTNGLVRSDHRLQPLRLSRGGLGADYEGRNKVLLPGCISTNDYGQDGTAGNTRSLRQHSYYHKGFVGQHYEDNLSERSLHHLPTRYEQPHHANPGQRWTHGPIPI